VKVGSEAVTVPTVTADPAEVNEDWMVLSIVVAAEVIVVELKDTVSGAEIV